jgi:hypothetical protein
VLRYLIGAFARAACWGALLATATVMATAAAQELRPASTDFFFVQLADTQFGAFTNDRDFVQESSNYEFAVANINRLKPAFVVICGDLINKPGDVAQRSEEGLRIVAVTPSSLSHEYYGFGAIPNMYPPPPPPPPPADGRR